MYRIAIGGKRRPAIDQAEGIRVFAQATKSICAALFACLRDGAGQGIEPLLRLAWVRMGQRFRALRGSRRQQVHSAIICFAARHMVPIALLKPGRRGII